MRMVDSVPFVSGRSVSRQTVAFVLFFLRGERMVYGVGVLVFYPDGGGVVVVDVMCVVLF